MTEMRLAVIIPAYNEAPTIITVVAGARQLGDVIVVDDGSCDDTPELARRAGAIVLSLRGNMGYERALDIGVRYAVDAQYEFALTMDADGQHRVEQARNLINALGTADVAIGTRVKKARPAEWVAGWIGARIWRVADPFSGLKLYRLRTCKALMPFDTRRLVGGEMFVRAHRAGLKLIALPIEVAQRADTPRFGLSWSANYRLLRAVLLLVAIDWGLLR